MLRWLTRIGLVLCGLVVLIVVAAVAAYAVAERRVGRQYAITPRAVVVPADSASVARGRHLAQSIGMCVECHGERLDGKVILDNPLGLVAARNLTRGMGGVGMLLTDADYVRAIRHGVSHDRRALMVMPAQDYRHLTDADLGAIIAYVKSLPPSDNMLPETELRTLGRALLAAGKLPLFAVDGIDHAAASPDAVPAGGTKEYGRYVARVACVGCHGPSLAGGPIAAADPSWPPASNLTVSGPTRDWSERDFVTLMRTGRRPDSIPVNRAMPWKSAGRMTDEELHAVWLYLRSVPGRATSTATHPASVTRTMRAASIGRAARVYFTWSIAQVQKIASSGDMSPRGDNLESE